TPSPRASRYARPWPATSAAAPATPRSSTPSSSPRCEWACEPRRARAARRANERRRPSVSKEHFTVVGQPLPKIDAWAKVTGETRYADDLVLPRMAYAKLLRSLHGHARILSI